MRRVRPAVFHMSEASAAVRLIDKVAGLSVFASRLNGRDHNADFNSMTVDRVHFSRDNSVAHICFCLASPQYASPSRAEATGRELTCV
jgi:hypothetical protein